MKNEYKRQLGFHAMLIATEAMLRIEELRAEQGRESDQVEYDLMNHIKEWLQENYAIPPTSISIPPPTLTMEQLYKKLQA